MFQVHFSMMHHGDIVFCTVHPMNCYYTHLVLDIEKDMFTHEKKYWIGNMQGRKNGWCFREHLHGIVMEILRCLEVLETQSAAMSHGTRLKRTPRTSPWPSCLPVTLVWMVARRGI